jgi:hypothetical protein
MNFVLSGMTGNDLFNNGHLAPFFTHINPEKRYTCVNKAQGTFLKVVYLRMTSLEP